MFLAFLATASPAATKVSYSCSLKAYNCWTWHIFLIQVSLEAISYLNYLVMSLKLMLLHLLQIKSRVKAAKLESWSLTASIRVQRYIQLLISLAPIKKLRNIVIRCSLVFSREYLLHSEYQFHLFTCDSSKQKNSQVCVT